MFRQFSSNTFFILPLQLSLFIRAPNLHAILWLAEKPALYFVSRKAESYTYTFTFSASSQMAFTKRSQLKRFLYLVMFSESMAACPEV
ncbi:hypothetical protein SAMN05421739_1078 [Pontibacter chinhatensis]|uniref:Uncharacterized protein n=1 Tax=Pontibacter chinhatensis TaxID=1436961 RepID=A0A1I2Y0P5_9BACT|nr:hypothetical protein SAMN05421739_1078 [Pontibacter chinhatensis]